MPAQVDPNLAVVTGAASDIGSACVDLLAGEGWTIVALDVDETKLLRRKSEVWHDADVRTVVADLRDSKVAIETIERKIEPGRRIDALLNIAGIFRTTSPEDFDADVATDILRINLVAPQALSCGLWNRFSADGCIVNAGSVSVSRFVPGATTYTASKAGLAALTFSLHCTAAETGLRIYCINFGRVRTPMIASQASSDVPAASSQEAAAEILACIEGNRRGKEGRMYPFIPYAERRRSATTS